MTGPRLRASQTGKNGFQLLHNGPRGLLRLGQRGTGCRSLTWRLAKTICALAPALPVELVGRVHGPGPSGEILVKAERPWRYADGVKVVDRRGRALGRVEAVIGPAAAPYLVVRTPDAKDPKGVGSRLKGAEVYVEAPEVEAGAQPQARPRKQGRPTGPAGHRP